ncbi:MAG: hypothetical protein HKP06_01115, partial [Flavobacteriaceae bacterium]|nr:hypothetical protein [Flavobacteriaceae bacterium]
MKYILTLILVLLTISIQAQDYDEPGSGYGCISGDCEDGLGKYVWKNGDYYYG